MVFEIPKISYSFFGVIFLMDENAVIIPCPINPKYTNLILGIRVWIRVRIRANHNSEPNPKPNPNPNPNPIPKD